MVKTLYMFSYSALASSSVEYRISVVTILRAHHEPLMSSRMNNRPFYTA